MKQRGRPEILGQGKTRGNQPREGKLDLLPAFNQLSPLSYCVPGPVLGSGEALVIAMCA